MTSIICRLFQRNVIIVFSSRKRLPRLYLLAGLLALGVFVLLGIPRQADGKPEIWRAAGLPSSHVVLSSSEPGSLTVSTTTYLPIVFKPVATLKSQVMKIRITLPHQLAEASGNWCTWGYCSLSPRGSANLIVWKAVADRQRKALVGARLLGVSGTVQREGDVLHVIARRLEDRSALLGSLAARSRDFH